jgi:hypothetical protein
VFSREVILNISLLIVSGARSMKNNGSAFLVFLCFKLVTCFTVKPISSRAEVISVGSVV